MGGIDRILRAIEKNEGGHIATLYGPGVSDIFINDLFRELKIDQALYESFRQSGFERILFYSPHRALYAYDQKSLHLSNELIAPENPIFESGPLEQYQAYTRQFNFTQSSQGIGDFHVLKFVDAILRLENNQRTAFVFLQAETSIRFYDDKRSLASIVGDWVNLSSKNQNICYFLFSVDTISELKQVVDNLSIPELRKVCPQSINHPSQIGYPDKKELKRAIEIFQKQNYDDEEMSRLAELLTHENRELRYWMEEFKNIKKSSQMISIQLASQKGWFSAVRNPGEKAIEKLENLVGLSNVKQRIEELIAWIELRKKKAIPEEDVNLHMIFCGNPGTGKTTVARLIGEIFHEMGWLKRGHIVEVQAGDLIADHVGGTMAKTKSFIEKAIDGILFIDEAYGLSEDGRGGFGNEALETLLTSMESERGKFVVICAGYPEKMEHFRNANPGLARRFPKENIIYFEDFSDYELFEILKINLTERKLSIDQQFLPILEILVKEISKKRDNNFGNAGEIRNLTDSLEKRHAFRISKDELPINSLLTDKDLSDYYRSFLPILEPTGSKEFWNSQLESLVGLKSVKDEMKQFSQRLEFEKLRHLAGIVVRDYRPLRHFIFTGNPGTGKTTVARLVGNMLKELGLLRRGHVVEVTRADLVAGYVGQTALRTRDSIQRALDGILFIDEAYSLLSNHLDFGKEALEELIKSMEVYQDRLVVIAAGYRQEIMELISSNPGIASRFGEPIDFPDFSFDELWEIMEKLIFEEHYTYEGGFPQKVKKYFEWMKIKDGIFFGNGRSVRTLFESVKNRAAKRILQEKIEKGLIPSAEHLSLLVTSDVPDPGFYLEFDSLPATKAAANSRV
jgi:SpoVK/Ycf46/Vps4 family AAA+-type ATPase